MAQRRPKGKKEQETHSTAIPTPTLTKKFTMGYWERFHTFLGFQKSYNAKLFCIFAPILFLFALERMQCLSLERFWAPNTAPGEWYWYHKGRERLGITIHLSTILPCGLLAVLQFVPALRQNKLRSFHRINGRIVLTLLWISNVGALMIARRAFGGTIETQTAAGFLVVITTIGSSMAFYNIKRLQIDQHRAWMLRTMFYMGAIITQRFILIAAALIISQTPEYHNVWPCDQIEWAWKYANAGNYLEAYPRCANQSVSSERYAPVLANLQSDNDPAQIGAGLQVPFGMAIWLSVMVNMIGVEIYLHLTPRGATRLRMESYKRQKAAGYANPGNEGLVPEKFGDADPWVVPAQWDVYEDDSRGGIGSDLTR
jgi:uncharacterized membrane protein